MGLKDIYQRFLDLPNPISLTENASFHYITTLTTFKSPAGIVQHLESQNKKVVRTKSTKVISVVESSNALALEVETVLEFISGGGAYLPGLENFIVDTIATIPTVRLSTANQEVLRLTMNLSRLTMFISMPTRRSLKSAFLGTRGPY